MTTTQSSPAAPAQDRAARPQAAERRGASPFRRLAREYLAPQRVRIGTAIACMLTVAGATALTAYLLDPAIRSIFVERDRKMLVLIPLAILAVSAVKAIAAYGQGVLMADVSRNLVVSIQKRLFSTLMHADLARLQSAHSGTHHTNFLQNTTQVAQSVNSGLIGVFRDVPTTIGLIVVMFVMDWQLALVATIAAPLIALLTRRLSKTAGKAMGGAINSTNQLAKRVAESLQGIRIVKAYGHEDDEAERAGELIDERMLHFFRAQRASLAAAPLTEAFGGIGVAGVIFYGGLRVMHGSIELSSFMTFIGSMMWAFQPMRTLSGLAGQYAQGMRAARVLFEEMDIEPSIKDTPHAPALHLQSTKGADVRLEDVSFAYGRDTPALSHVSLGAGPGETVALVGPSGAGKTTILNLLLRFYDPTSGRITIDDQDIRSVSQASLRNQMALVSQDTMLFDDTIAANIAYGGEGDVHAAAHLAAADDFIEALPKGYETRTGELGNQLSGGQRQRIAIARAFLKNAPILLLDEATSSLDSQSEARIQAALTQLMQGRTTFVIAHRLSTVLAADRIYVLDEGRLRESGTHEELLAYGGLYRNLYQSQFGKTSAAIGEMYPNATVSL